MTSPADLVLVAWTDRYDAVVLATELATELLGTHPGPLHHRCPTCGSIEHGQPSFDAAVAVSIARAGGRTLVAVSTAGQVGVDVEADDVATETWVRTEAEAKAHGVGITVPLPADDVPVQFHRVPVPGHVAVVAVLGTDPVEIRTRPAGPEAPGRPTTS